MFVGHFGIGLAAKAAVPRVSLGTLFLSVQLADGLWPLLLLLGAEHVHIVPNMMRTSHLNFWDYPISHSLLALCAWGVLFGAVYFLTTRFLAGALLLAAGVVSHWVLDFVMHRPDMPILPSGPVRRPRPLEFAARHARRRRARSLPPGSRSTFASRAPGTPSGRGRSGPCSSSFRQSGWPRCSALRRRASAPSPGRRWPPGSSCPGDTGSTGTGSCDPRVKLLEKGRIRDHPLARSSGGLRSHAGA